MCPQTPSSPTQPAPAPANKPSWPINSQQLLNFILFSISQRFSHYPLTNLLFFSLKKNILRFGNLKPKLGKIWKYNGEKSSAQSDAEIPARLELSRAWRGWGWHGLYPSILFDLLICYVFLFSSSLWYCFVVELMLCYYVLVNFANFSNFLRRQWMRMMIVLVNWWWDNCIGTQDLAGWCI